MSLPAAPEGRASTAVQAARVPVWLLVFLTFVTAGILQAASVDWSRSLSEYDEVPHIDYAVRLVDGHVTTWDDVYTQRTLGLAECLEAQSLDPNCMNREIRIPQERWPNGHSYEAQQAPPAYVPYALALRFVISESDNHFAQIRELRLVNGLFWILLAVAWSALLLQVTRNLVASLAVTLVVATNPLLFDSFTYVTNDAAALVVATGASAWLLHLLRIGSKVSSVHWLPVALMWGLLLGLTKATSLIILIALGLAVWASHRFAGTRKASRAWWMALLSVASIGTTASLVYQQLIEWRSQLTFKEVFSVILPRGPLDLPDSAFVRITDITELLVGSGARTDELMLDSGIRTVSSLALTFSILGALAFVVALTLRNRHFERIPILSHSTLGIAVLASSVLLLLLWPTIQAIQGGFLTYVNIGRYLATLVPLAGLVALITFQRFRMWAWLTILGGLFVAIFSGPWSQIQANIGFVTHSLGL